MKTTKPTLKPRVQYYDRVEMKNYYEHKHAFIFGWEEIVHQEKIGSTATLDI